MIQINAYSRIRSLPNHTEHYCSAYHDRIIKLMPYTVPGWSAPLFSLDIKSEHDERYSQTLNRLNEFQAIQVIKLFLAGPEAKEHEIFTAWINQAERECECVKVTKTRARIEYDMPNTGTNGAWRNLVTIAGIKFIDDTYGTAAEALREN